MTGNLPKIVNDFFEQYLRLEGKPNLEEQVSEWRLVFWRPGHKPVLMQEHFRVSRELMNMANSDPIYFKVAERFEHMMMHLLDSTHDYKVLKDSRWERIKFVFKK